MTGSYDDGPGSGAVLRAVASLLMALGHQGGPRPVSGESEALRYAAPSPPPLAPEPASGFRVPGDFASMIEEARERAQRVLDEGIERARTLSRPGGASVSAGGAVTGDLEAARQFDELRRSIALMSDDLRDVQQRLARIEMMLRGGGRPEATVPPLAPRVSIAPPPAAPSAAPPPYTPPTYAPPSPHAPPRVDLPAAPPALPPIPPRWAEQPAGLPPSAVPPMRAPQALPPFPPAPAAPPVVAPLPPLSPPPAVAPAAPPPAPTVAEATPPARPAGASGSGGAPLATFVPEDGSVLVRVAPVAGFQGLMRVQDALARLRGVRQTAVEAYSQGEARLRLELTEVTDSDEIADGLAGTLSMPAQVRDASEAERSMLIVLG